MLKVRLKRWLLDNPDRFIATYKIVGEPGHFLFECHSGVDGGSVYYRIAKCTEVDGAYNVFSDKFDVAGIHHTANYAQIFAKHGIELER